MRLALLVFGAVMAATTYSQSEIDGLNVVWTTPSKDASGSMPLGNGEVGLNVWVEEGGDLLFYVSRTDAWSEASRLLKLGRVRVRITPNPFEKGKPFRQELILRDGRISIKAGDVDLNIFVDSARPVIHVTGQWLSEHKLTANLETWRTERRQLRGAELASSWTMQDSLTPVWESADVLTVSDRSQVLYHRNESSIVPLTLEHQGLSRFSDLVRDPIKDRIFGLGLVQESRNRSSYVRVVAESVQAAKTGQFTDSLFRHLKESMPLEASKRTVEWWRAFWDRSYIFVEGDAATSLPESKHKLRVGHDSNGQNRFSGEISNAVVYDRALSRQELAALPTSQPPNPVLSQSVQGRKRLLATVFEGTDPGVFFESVDPAPFDLRQGFTVAALITPKRPIGRIFDMLTAGQGDGFLFDTHPGYALRAVVGDQTLVSPGALEEGKQVHVSLTVTPRGGIRIYKDGKLLSEVPEDPVENKVSRAYALQRYMQACAGRGNFPIKFNGSIFTVEPKFLGQEFNPDWRRWGDCYWWQNTRLPYYAMPAAGDFDLMLPLFRMYEAVKPLSEARAKFYYGAQGGYFPETMTPFGTYANKDYGWDRTGLEPGDVQSAWWRFAWNQSLELLDLMFDYQAPNETAQRDFEKGKLNPMLSSSLAYFRSRFRAPGGDTLRLSPTQSVETYWYDVVNDTPSVAGLHRIAQRSSQRTGMKAEDLKVPPVPLKDGKIAPAEMYKDQRNNVENPEFYAIWPFRLYGIGRTGLEIAQKTFRERIEKANAGWQYDGQVAALCGLTDEARASLLRKVRNSNPAFRWPASWGPNYDWLPDQCHGANIMITLQTMCLQEASGKLYVLPAFPKDWSVKFKLHASGGAVVTASYERGKLVRATVTPASRTKDLVIGLASP